jgi:hypothetical protein
MSDENQLPSLNEKMPMPCNDCANEDKCATEGLDCKAFRNWSAVSEYKETEKGKWLKKLSW